MSTDPPLIEIADPDQDRYARLRLMQGYNHATVQAAQVMVVGAGALGNEVLKNLALLGVGHILVVDMDTIEISNLTRSVLFRAEDATSKRPKAEVVAERVREINPDVHIHALHGDVGREVGLGLFAAMDVVLGCLDNREARLAVNRACWHTGTPYIDGALNVADGSLRVFLPPEGACYECLMTKQDYALMNLRYACPPGTVRDGLQLTTPMSASIIGAMQVQEAVKLLHKVPMQGGQGVVYSAETMRTLNLDYPRRADCPVHQPEAPRHELTAGVAELSVSDVIEQARAHLKGKPQLVLRDRVVTYFYCEACDAAEKVYRPYHAVVPRQVKCPTCQRERIYDVAISVSGGAETHDLPLTQLGFPPFDWLELRSSYGDRLLLELNGDRARALPWNEVESKNHAK